jgi:hypothetical protein
MTFPETSESLKGAPDWDNVVPDKARFVIELAPTVPEVEMSSSTKKPFPVS